MKNKYWILGAIVLGAFLLWKKAQAGIAKSALDAFNEDEGVEAPTPPPLDFSGAKFL